MQSGGFAPPAAIGGCAQPATRRGGAQSGRVWAVETGVGVSNSGFDGLQPVGGYSHGFVKGRSFGLADLLHSIVRIAPIRDSPHEQALLNESSGSHTVLISNSELRTPGLNCMVWISLFRSANRVHWLGLCSGG